MRSVGCRALFCLALVLQTSMNHYQHLVIPTTGRSYVMRFSEGGVERLKRLEAFSPRLYSDSKGFAIGYGCFVRPKDLGRYAHVTLTEAQGVELLKQRVEPIEAYLRTAIVVPLNQNQFDALVLLAYNIGLGTFGRSHLLALLNRGQYHLAAAQFGVFIKADGKVKQGLVTRRKEEARLFETI